MWSCQLLEVHRTSMRAPPGHQIQPAGVFPTHVPGWSRPQMTSDDIFWLKHGKTIVYHYDGVVHIRASRSSASP